MSYLRLMRGSLAKHTVTRRAGAAALAVFAAVLALASPAATSDLTYGRPPVSELSPMESFMLRNVQRREAFQADQLRLRSLDRQMSGTRLRQPRVPVVKPTCQTQVFGSNFLRSCR